MKQISSILQFIKGSKLKIKKLLMKFILYKYKLIDGLYGTKCNTVDNIVVFDLDSKSTLHLGDVLQFLPVIDCLSFSKIVYIIARNERKKLFNILLSNPLNVIFIDDHSYIRSIKEKLYVTSLGKLKDLSFVLMKKPFLIADFASPLLNKFPYKLFEDYFKIELLSKTINNQKILFPPVCYPTEYIIFNDQVESGIFRIPKSFFIKLYTCAVSISMSEKLPIIYVGIDNNNKNFNEYAAKSGCVLYDLRGNTSVEDVISFIANPRCKLVITFDNFIMHLAHMFEKKTFVKFRGKRTKSEEIFHFNFINPSFLGEHKYICYL